MMKHVAVALSVLTLAGVGLVMTPEARAQTAVRLEQEQPSWAEWFEWLAEQSYVAKRSKPPTATSAIATAATAGI